MADMWKYNLFNPLEGDVNYILYTVDVDADDEGRPRDYCVQILTGMLHAGSDEEIKELAQLIASAPELRWENQRLKERLSKYEQLIDNTDPIF
jgi:hypothetical protein